MVLRRWDPFNELRRIQDNMDQFRHGLAPTTGGGPDLESWAIPLDVVQEGDDIIVRASLPGVHPNDINVSIESDVLTLRGQTVGAGERQEGNYLMRERHTGFFHRSLRLPDTLDTEKAQPRYENGVLTIAFPKLEAKQSRQLKVVVAETLEAGASDPA